MKFRLFVTHSILRVYT